ncbi:hypothetical protein [Actinomadura fibrosa]|uniref:Cysteine-rich CPCC domain-containing protein n=1 Tax=Actinomadura fibrosa TaxID=111802 RepID=A0ABW2XLE0_9ACTN|nr:hypothetical protein [Actinomadura fibrosa]
MSRCPACCRTRYARHYLCRPCWWTLPAPARAALNRRDRRAAARLIELHRQLRARVPLNEIEVTP